MYTEHLKPQNSIKKLWMDTENRNDNPSTYLPVRSTLEAKYAIMNSELSGSPINEICCEDLYQGTLFGRWKHRNGKTYLRVTIQKEILGRSEGGVYVK